MAWRSRNTEQALKTAATLIQTQLGEVLSGLSSVDARSPRVLLPLTSLRVPPR